MVENVYDDADFFAAYSRLPRSVEGLDGAPEWPVLRAMLPDPAGGRVLDLVCGFGWFCRWVTANGAHSVLGVDSSDRMLRRARSEPSDPAITYHDADLATLEPGGPVLAPGRFDLAFSSLALHYLADIGRVFDVIAALLVPGGRLVFSVEHPVFTSPSHPAFVEGPNQDRVWPLDGYLREGPRSADWLGSRVDKHHRTIGTYVGALRDAGFRLDELVEWGPSEEQVAAVPAWAAELERPMFLLVSAARDEPR